MENYKKLPLDVKSVIVKEPVNRISIIQSYIDRLSAKKYLEVGVQFGHCFSEIKCDYKVGVDPSKESMATVFKTSNDFFAENKEKFDVIFIDGLHHSEVVYSDIINSLNCLEQGGVILMHDCLPTNEFMQQIPITSQHFWTGDTWKAYVKIRQERDDLYMRVVSTDWGVGIIERGKQEKLVIDVEVNYENFDKFNEKWLNLISVQEFINSMKIG
jgi:hypothetical protein